jgi:hypothetical protein
MSARPSYAQPFHWWGPGWGTPNERRIGDLLRDGTLDPRTAALIWAALDRRFSLVVLAGGSGVGKTTLLSALLDLLPENTRRVYLRGCFETFAFLADVAVVPDQTTLLINEISPHLPVYLWGPAMARTLKLREHGFALLATAHGESAEEFIGSLTGSPLRVPVADIAAFDLGVVLAAQASGIEVRRVTDLVRLHRTRDGLRLERAPHPSPRDISHEPNNNSDLTPNWFPASEIRDRARLLCQLRDGHISQLPNSYFVGGTDAPTP